MKLLYGFTVPHTARVSLRGQADFMDSAGYELHIVASPGPDLEQCREDYPVTVHELHMSREINIAQDVRSFFSWLRILRRIRPDIVNYGTPKASLLAALACFVSRVPRRVYVVRGLRFEGEVGGRRRLLLWAERLIAFCSTDIVVVSRSVGHVLRDENITSKRLLLIGSGSSNGVDIESWNKKASAVPISQVRNSLGLSPQDFVVLFVGRINTDKGISTLIEMATLLGKLDSRVKVVAAGRVESPAVAEKIRKSNDSVQLIDYQANLAPIYAVADVLVLPTRREGFPRVVLEAASLNVPTITTRATGAIDSVVDGETGFVVGVGDSVAMADRVMQLVSDPDRTAAMGRAAATRVAADFRPIDIWEGLSSIYRGSTHKNVRYL